MGRSELALAASLLVAVALCPAGSHAKPASSAEQLFDEGVKHMLSGRFEQGCPLIRQSYDLEPLHGALFTLAECHRKWGKGVEAYGLYRDFMAKIERIAPELREKESDRIAVAGEQLAELRRELAFVALELPATAPAGAVVTLDGEEIDRSALGTELALEPGSHVITVGLPDEEGRTIEEELEAGEVKTLTLEVKPSGASGDDGTEPDGDEEGIGTQRAVAIAVGGVGVAGVVVGAITGGLAIGQRGTADDNCSEDNVCNADGLDAVDTGRTMGTVSTVGFVVGAAGLAAGVVLWLTAPDADEPATGRSSRRGWSVGAAVSPSRTGLDLRATW
ncbi:MAG: hypothetical protein JRI23_24855 [Deltaproteobacteria bacterium]|jgi:hypothetical protein|nr:hypothetical protein [Deltaproteobacteria bacterium]MBW2535243.1 hypothetical protein [Deltaproteobacteria bacterium]